jgi:hypothetical protein
MLPMLKCLAFLFVCLLLVIRSFLSSMFLIFICLFIDFILLPFSHSVCFFFLIGTYFRPNNSINYSASGLCYLNPSRILCIVQPRKLLNDRRMMSSCEESYSNRGFQCSPKICIDFNCSYHPSFFAISDHHHMLYKYEASLRQSAV